jgi:hypothetical protein
MLQGNIQGLAGPGGGQGYSVVSNPMQSNSMQSGTMPNYGNQLHGGSGAVSSNGMQPLQGGWNQQQQQYMQNQAGWNQPGNWRQNQGMMQPNSNMSSNMGQSSPGMPPAFQQGNYHAQNGPPGGHNYQSHPNQGYMYNRMPSTHMQRPAPYRGIQQSMMHGRGPQMTAMQAMQQAQAQQAPSGLPQNLLQQVDAQLLAGVGPQQQPQQGGLGSGLMFDNPQRSMGSPLGGGQQMQSGLMKGGYQPTAGVGFILGDQKADSSAQSSSTAPLPPPPPKAEGDGSDSGATGSDAVVFAARYELLKTKWPAVEVPGDIWSWSLPELEDFYESGGIKRPKAPERKAGPPRKRNPGEEYSVQEALQLQGQLHDGFADAPFQDALKRLQTRYPQRKSKGHTDGTLFFEAFEALTLSVHMRVLPEWHLSADWDGVREMISLMTKALDHPKVRKKQEEINMLMGLPRDATFKPPTKGEDMFIYRPNRDGHVPGYPLDLVHDDDGDEGHEFLVEDRETGELRPCGPSALDQACWFEVVHKPAVVIRARPDVKSDMVGRKKFGKQVRVAKVVDGKWLQLHHSELPKLGAQEAWVLLDGAEQGLAGETLLERVK